MEGGEGNAKRGCGRWMEDCGRGAAVEQLTARGMEYQSPQWGGNSNFNSTGISTECINPRDGGAIALFSALGGNNSSINPRDGGQ